MSGNKDDNEADAASTSQQSTSPPRDDAQSSSCLACKKVIHDGKSSSVQCSLCSCWSHVKCSMNKEVFDLLTKICKRDNGNKKKTMVFVGMVPYICAGCQGFLKSNSVISNDANINGSSATVANASTQATGNTSSPTSCGTSTQVEHIVPSTTIIGTSTATDPISDATTRANEHKREDSRPICHLYKQGKCPHGKSGNRMINGQRCNFQHPRKCIKYCRFGSDKYQGCIGTCEFFHPILCRNSVRYRQCYSYNCTFAHLAGTERYERHFSLPNQHSNNKSQSNQHEFYVQNRYRSQPRNRLYEKNSGHSYNVQPNMLQTEHKGYRYNSRDFPPLTSLQPNRVDELSLSIKQMQTCIDYLMQSFNYNGQQHHIANNYQRGSFQPQQTYNHPQPMMNNPQHIFNNRAQEEAKNCT